MNWYKHSQLTAVEDVVSTDIGNGTPPPPIDDNGGGGDDSGNEDFHPTRDMMYVIQQWAKSHEMGELKKEIAQYILQKDSEIACIMDYQSEHVSATQTGGTGYIKIKYELKEEDMEYSIVEMNAKQKVLQSNLGTLINVDNLTLQKYLESQSFIQAIMYNLVLNSLEENVNFCSFKLYEDDLSQYEELLLQKIKLFLDRAGVKNPDWTKLKKGPISQSCSNQSYQAMSGIHGVYMGLIRFSFEIPTWKYEQKPDSLFESLEVEQQRDFIYAFHDTFEEIIEEEGILDRVEIDASYVSDDVDEVDLNVIFEPKVVTVPFSLRQLSSVIELDEATMFKYLQSIPKSLLQIFGGKEAGRNIQVNNAGPYKNDKIDIEVNYYLKEISLANGTPIMHIEVEGDWI